MKRKPLDIKKAILAILESEGATSVKKLEKKVNTNYQTILNNCEELEYFGKVSLSREDWNGRETLVASIIKNRLPHH